jgi:pyruvate/2-oxoglutarate dehydrogenase complex dihydrolipoamide acyltransferase (E2) component
MATPIGMPKLATTMTEGRVVAWLTTPGTLVAAGAPVVLIETDKSDVEVSAPTAGVLRHTYVDAGTTVPCGALLGALTATLDEPFDALEFHRANHRPDIDALPLPEVPPPLPPEDSR